jgi:hypothetical protein
MSIEVRRITVSGIAVEVVRKDIKNLHLGVYPPHGRVRVAAPLAVGDDAVRLAVIGKLGWIRKQKARFDGQARQTRREMVTGESHYLLGQRYRLRVHHHDGAARISLQGRSINLFVRQTATADDRERILQRWYRAQLKALIPPLLDKWEQATGVRPTTWGVKKMKTKWGSCNADARRIWLNLELAKRPVQCVEYIVVHELVHLVERKHGERFTALMDTYLPSWRLLREELNRGPLGHDAWQY